MKPSRYRLKFPLLAMMLVVAACQTPTAEPERHLPTERIEDTTVPSMAPDPTFEITPDEAAPQRLQPVRVACSTSLPDFPCSALIDGSLETDWQAPDGGISARITFAFDHPYKITEIGFANLPDGTRFLRNGRIKDVEFAQDDLSQHTYISLDDDNAATQWFAIRSLRTSVVTVTVTSAYPGVSVDESPPFAELALAEIMFTGTEIEPNGGPDTPNTTSVATSLVDEVVVDAPTGTWHRTNPDLGGLYVDTRDMIWDGTDFYLLTRIGFGDVIVWRSRDGVEWTEHSQIGTAGTIDGPHELVSVSGLLLAAGWRGSTATVWIDEGTTPWREVEVGPGAIRSLVHFNGIYVALGASAVGSERPGPSPASVHGVIWASRDAETWTEVAGAGIFGEDSQAVGLLEGPAGLLTIGLERSDPSEMRAALIATSTDGMDWTAHQPVGLDAGWVSGLTGGPDGYAVHGLSSPFLRSPDGINWTPLPFDQSLIPEGLSRATALPGPMASFQGQLVVAGGVFVDPRDAYNYMLPRVWIHLGQGQWADLGASEWFDNPGVAYEMVAGDDRLVVHGEAESEGWAIFTFILDGSE